MQPKSKANFLKKINLKTGDLPATRNMLTLVRDELKEDIKGLRLDMQKDGVLVRSEIDSLRSDMQTDFAKVRADIYALNAQITKLEASMHRSALLAEEQRAENRMVLDGIRALWSRQDRIEGNKDSIDG
jgi:hypothetical protein